jgi:hypothetical protein
MINKGEQIGMMGIPLHLSAQTGDYFPNVLNQAVNILGASNYSHEPFVRIVFNDSKYDIWRDTQIKWVLKLRQLCRLPMYQDSHIDLWIKDAIEKSKRSTEIAT